MNEIGKIYLEFELNAINEIELIKNVVEYARQNPKSNNNLAKIIRLNIKTNERLLAPKLLNEFIELNLPDYDNQKEYFALTILKEQCGNLIYKKIKPYKLWGMIKPIEEIFDFPIWLGELYNVLDWCSPETELEDYMVEEARQRINEINQLIITKYNTSNRCTP